MIPTRCGLHAHRRPIPDLPLSVVTIVAPDLLDSRHLTIPTPSEVLPDIALLEEVLHGLRALNL